MGTVCYDRLRHRHTLLSRDVYEMASGAPTLTPSLFWHQERHGSSLLTGCTSLTNVRNKRIKPAGSVSARSDAGPLPQRLCDRHTDISACHQCRSLPNTLIYPSVLSAWRALPQDERAERVPCPGRWLLGV